jgi:hypothetical protein
MHMVDENMDLLTINDHLNKTQYDLNQTNRTMTSPRNIIKSQSESAFNQLSEFNKFLDKKVTNKGTDVKVFGHKLPDFDESVINISSNVNKGKSKIDNILVNESRYNQDPSVANSKMQISSSQDFGAPTKRKDAQKLNNWLDFMLEK